MDKRIINLHKSFEKGIRNIFQITAYIILIGNIFDLIRFSGENKYIEYTNVINSSLIAIVLAGFYMKWIPYKKGFTIVIYSLLINIYIGKFLSLIPPDNPARLDFFLRDSLFVLLLLALASFSLHKIHAFIIGISYLVLASIFAFYLNKSFLFESLPLIIIVILGYTGLIYYLVGLFEKVLLSEQEIANHIRKQNQDLSEVNVLLEEKQQIIEEQSTRLEEQSRELKIKNQELIKANDSKNTFFSIIAHDLRNPFNLILGFTSYIREKYNILTEDKRRHYLGLIETTSLRTYTLLENLLSWARSQTNSIKLNPKKIIINDIVRDVIELFNVQTSKKELNVIFNPNGVYEAYADRDMISTVMRNLYSNAVKFSNPNGILMLSIHKENEFILVSIKDTGVGMPPDVISKLFDISQHYTTVGTNGETGSGLGLILCWEFMIKNSGKIFVESTEGKGSTFTMSIPIFKPKD